MISTKRFAGRSITRTLTIGLLALTLAAGARIQLGVAEGHAANTIGSATIAEPGAICLVGYPRYVQVYSPTLVAYDRPQYVEWWVELVENGTEHRAHLCLARHHRRGSGRPRPHGAVLFPYRSPAGDARRPRRRRG